MSLIRLAGLVGPELSHVAESRRNCPHRIVVDVELEVHESFAFERTDPGTKESTVIATTLPTVSDRLSAPRLDLWTFECNSPGKYVHESVWRVREINGVGL
jgi:hypothetical protein